MPSMLAAVAIAATAVLPAAVSAQSVTAPTNLTLKKGAAGVNVRYKEVCVDFVSLVSLFLPASGLPA